MADAEAGQVADRRGARAGAMIQELQQLLGQQAAPPVAPPVLPVPDLLPGPQPQEAQRLALMEQASIFL